VQVSTWVWGLFAVIVLAALAIDLGLLRTSRGEDRELTDATVDPATLDLARTLEERHRWPYD